jgi:hypothetical protein
MNNRGKAALAALGNAPHLGAQVAPAQANAGGGQYGFTARNPAFAPLAEELSMWANGDLSFLAGRLPMTGTPVRPDKDKRRGPQYGDPNWSPDSREKRKRDAMADVLEGKS